MLFKGGRQWQIFRKKGIARCIGVLYKCPQWSGLELEAGTISRLLMWEGTPLLGPLLLFSGICINWSMESKSELAMRFKHSDM